MKVILLTGASKGIGKATAEKLAKENVQLILTSRSADKLEALTGELRRKGGNVENHPADIKNETEVQALVQSILEKHGRIDILINNAGLGIFKPVEELTVDDWHTVMETNVKGTLLTTKAVVPAMKEQKSGLIINVESDVAVRGEPQLALYASSKFAQEGFTRSIRKELRPWGIRVSSVYPGVTDTEFHPDTPENRNREGWLKPEDIAEAVSYIASTPEAVVVDELTVHPKIQDY